MWGGTVSPLTLLTFESRKLLLKTGFQLNLQVRKILLHFFSSSRDGLKLAPPFPAAFPRELIVSWSSTFLLPMIFIDFSSSDIFERK